MVKKVCDSVEYTRFSSGLHHKGVRYFGLGCDKVIPHCDRIYDDDGDGDCNDENNLTMVACDNLKVCEN